ncbi:MAG: glycosyltransferase family 39 protein, partial [Bacteroidota bacterium]
MKQNKNSKKQVSLIKKPTSKQKKVDDWKWLNYLPYFLLVGLILLVYIIRSNYSEIPFERDEGDYFYIAQLILDGKIPYIDFYEQKLPGLFYTYSLIISLFGATLKGAHLGFLFINLFTTVIMFFIGKKLFNGIFAFITAFSFAIFSLTPHMSGFTTQSEHLVIFFASGGFLALIYAMKNQKKWYLFLISGLLICYSFLIKQTAVFFIL